MAQTTGPPRTSIRRAWACTFQPPPLPSEDDTYETGDGRVWPGLSVEGPQNVLSCSLCPLSGVWAPAPPAVEKIQHK